MPFINAYVGETVPIISDQSIPMLFHENISIDIVHWGSRPGRLASIGDAAGRVILEHTSLGAAKYLIVTTGPIRSRASKSC